jgi:hypothetical protein
MIRMDQETTQKPMGEIDKFEVVMAQIPTKALYGLQTIIMKEMKSIARIDVANLEVGRGVAEMLQITCDQLTSEKEEEKQCADKLEQGIPMIYNHIPYSAKEPKRIA